MNLKAFSTLVPLLMVAIALGQAPVQLKAPVSKPAKAAKPAVSTAPKKHDTMFMKTSVGSFKILSPGEDMAEGTVTMHFKGTVLVAGLQGTAVPSGNVKLEYDRPERNKKVYYGQGSLKITGRFYAVQFFGRDLDANFNGFGIVRLYGEFDKNLSTGEFWYASQPTKHFWNTGGITLSNPPFKAEDAVPQGTVKDVGGKG